MKVLDFGLAKLREPEAVATTAPTRELTGEGRILGTVACMSPEQAEGKPVDACSDVFSLGVMLCEMATGERPFKGDTQVALISAIIKDSPASVTDLKHDLPRDLSRIVQRCLKKDPEDRYQTAKDLRNDRRGRGGRADAARRPAARRQRIRPGAPDRHHAVARRVGSRLAPRRRRAADQRAGPCQATTRARCGWSRIRTAIRAA